MYHKTQIFVGRINEDKIEFIDDSYSMSYSSDIEINYLIKGKYIIFCHLEIEENKLALYNNENKKMAILKIYTNQEFLILDYLTTKDINYYLSLDLLMYDFYFRKLSKKTDEKIKYIIDNDSSISYQSYRINKYSKFIVFLLKNERPNTNILIKFKNKNNQAIFLSDFDEIKNCKDNSFIKLIPANNNFLLTIYGGDFSYEFSHKVFYSVDELKNKLKIEGKLNTFSGINYIVYVMITVFVSTL